MNYVQLMQPVIQQAAELAVSHFRKNMTVFYKKDLSIVTDVDLAVQQILIDGLIKALPGSGYLAEEGKISHIQEFTWVIDPIDGTKNFVRGLPYFCINVALMHASKVIAAVTYQPVTDEWFCAQKGLGAFLNGQPLKLSDEWRQTGALVVVADAIARNNNFLNQVKASLKIVDNGVRFRINGAVALDLAYIASGMFDVVIFQNLAWWDVAAGILLVQEAGGWVSQHDGLMLDQQSKTLIAGDPQLCKMIINLINLQK
ncbi:inositol monophosphatase [Candidatus Babeliales bacterium]|nr:inositol monophosphatase [Candidatus Babeliales bacterium]